MKTWKDFSFFLSGMVFVKFELVLFFRKPVVLKIVDCVWKVFVSLLFVFASNLLTLAYLNYSATKKLRGSL